MIKIVNIGMNHETAPVELRECLAREGDAAALSFLRETPGIKESLFLSTCNRVEALYTTEDPVEARNSVIAVFARLGGLTADRLLPSLYHFENGEAAGHIFKVASSLDSMILGEPQILGQIKEAYRQATQQKTAGVILNRLMHRAFRVAKRVRTETNLADATVSISYAAIELAKKIFYDLRNKKALLIGAGEIAELAARHLLSHGLTSIAVANRTFKRAMEVAETFQGSAVSFDEIGAQLLEVDIVITATASQGYVIGYDQVKGSLRKRRNRPLFFIDIAVPRDVDPDVNNLENVYVYDIDDLKGVIEVNKARRREEAIKAERIVQEEVIKFERWLKTMDVVPTIVSLKDKVEAIRKNEFNKSLTNLKDLSASQMKVVETLTLSIAEKIITDPILVLKKKADRSSHDNYLDIAKNLFKLDQGNDESEEQG